MRHHLEDYLENQLNQLKKIPRPITIGLVCVFGVALVGWILPPILWPGGIGIGKDNPVSTMTIEKDAQGKTVKTIETIKYDDGKTLWDWGSLLGVPLSLAILGYVLQQQQQKRAEKLSEDQRERAEKLSKEQQERAEKFAKEQRDIADNETKEEVLQTYFDRLSILLIDRNLIVLSNKSDFRVIHPEEKELLDSSLDVIRARTLSILRRFENDAERKTSVIKFLIETEIVGKSKLNLSGANLSGANLQGVDLQGAKLFMANLSGANLSGANLSRAKLFKANLSAANLSSAILYEVNLYEADLSRTNLSSAIFYEANLSGANLSEANLSVADLQGANLQGANLCLAELEGAKLFLANLYLANLQGANLEWVNLRGANLADIQWDSRTTWPDKSQFNNTRNIPEELKKELGINP